MLEKRHEVSIEKLYKRFQKLCAKLSEENLEELTVCDDIVHLETLVDMNKFMRTDLHEFIARSISKGDPIAIGFRTLSHGGFMIVHQKDLPEKCCAITTTVEDQQVYITSVKDYLRCFKIEVEDVV